MKKKRFVAAGLGVIASLSISTSPAQAVTWGSDIIGIKNAYTGKCLSGSGRTVSQTTCGLPVSGGSRSTDWLMADIDPSVKRVMLRNKSTNLCLDNNGTDVYLSGCSSDDVGQQWHFNTCSGMIVSLVSPQSDVRTLTGWNTGGVSVTSWGEADEWAKSEWYLTSGRPAWCP
ncbi:ricin-type beta-trefoil lectin domain protein [Streptomyces sp. NPDC052727]|uniref:ricin-type beta-trefoil lectin domain protein n=1 Tax=Streptomyces sp. NPDC052727 TaxID=3154854 RepID=UPI003443DDF8